MDEMTSRFEGLDMNLNDYTFHILGCGAIGSAAATTLARMGGRHFILYDNDRVEVVNIGVSQYNITHVGLDKVSALETMIMQINGDARVHAENGWFKEYLYNGRNEIIILGFDSMKSRMEAVEIISNSNWPQPAWLIDGRMGAEQYQQYVIEGPHGLLKNYIDIWYSDADSSTEPCNLKATAYCSVMAGAFIANAVRKITTNQPFFREGISFNFPIMRLATLSTNKT